MLNVEVSLIDELTLLWSCTVQVQSGPFDGVLENVTETFNKVTGRGDEEHGKPESGEVNEEEKKEEEKKEEEGGECDFLFYLVWIDLSGSS